MSRTRGVIVALAFLAWVGCDKPKTGPSGTGSVKGIVTAADGITRVGAATVSLASTGPPSTVADSQGAYTLTSLPVGQQSLKAKKGNFEVVFAVTVKENETVTAPAAKLVAVGKLAFVPGAFDSIERVVRDQLGNAMDQLTSQQLSSSSVLAQYKMIFLNCGLDDFNAGQSATNQALLGFVRGGGTLYASDFAVSYIRGMLPQDITQTENADPQTITATVTDSALQSFIGRNTAQIRYDLDGWFGLRQVSSRSRVLLRGNYLADSGPVSNRPLAIVIDEGAGRVVYTTFHNEPGVTPDQIAVLRFFVFID